MKFAVVSDTHGNVTNFKKVVAWLNVQGIKLILHAGDIGNPESLKESVEEFNGELHGVLGNMDMDYKILISEYNNIPNIKIEEYVLETEIEGKFIAVTHFPEKAKGLAETGNYNLVFYGHTHKPWEEKVRVKSGLTRTCRIINPGELTGQMCKPTFAVYDTETDRLELKILERI